jgi:hypothetical protein
MLDERCGLVSAAVYGQRPSDGGVIYDQIATGRGTNAISLGASSQNNDRCGHKDQRQTTRSGFVFRLTSPHFTRKRSEFNFTAFVARSGTSDQSKTDCINPRDKRKQI